MNRKSPLVILSTLIIVFILGIVLGRFVMLGKKQSNQSASNVSISTSTSSRLSDTQSANQAASASVQSSPQVTSSPKSLSCGEALNADIKKNGTEYEKGTIIVTFVSTTSFDQAKSLIASYGLRIENESAARSSYATTPIVTVVVPSGKEVSYICQLRQNSHIKYAGLNPKFSLHN